MEKEDTLVQYRALVELLASVEPDLVAYVEKGNGAAGRRARVSLRAVKKSVAEFGKTLLELGKTSK